MLLKTLILFQVCFVLSQAALTRYQSQTVVKFEIKAVPQPVCKCTGDKCNLDVKATGHFCKTILERFEYYGHPNPYFMLCEFDPQTCEGQKSTTPKTYLVDFIFDAYYLATSPFYFGGETASRVLTQLFNCNDTATSALSKEPPVLKTSHNGIISMPFVYRGILNVKASDAGRYDLCYEKSCHDTINEICDGFTTAMKTTSPKLMEQFQGCSVYRIYTIDKEVHVAWSMMFHHRGVISSGTAKTLQELRSLAYSSLKDIKLPPILKSAAVSAIHPLDYCEITATTLTTQKYHNDMLDPTSTRYRIDSREYYQSLNQQLLIGDLKCPSCLRKAIGLNFANEGGRAKVSMSLWVSLTCAKKRGMKNCKDVRDAIAESWKTGSTVMYNDMTPKYEFSSMWEGASFEV